jgi:hypothetical protein
VLVVDIGPLATSILAKMMENQTNCVTHRFNEQVVNGVTEEFRPAEKRFCLNFGNSALYYAQVAHTTQF